MRQNALFNCVPFFLRELVPDPPIDLGVQRILWGLSSGSMTSLQDRRDPYTQAAIPLRRTGPPRMSFMARSGDGQFGSRSVSWTPLSMLITHSGCITGTWSHVQPRRKACAA